MREKIRIGLIGCGKISHSYMSTLGRFEFLEVSACADSVREKAEERAGEFGIHAVLSPDEIIKRPDIDMILNLTVPASHGEIALKALESGKSVYNEKPLAAAREEGEKIVKTARDRGLLAGCAPDTFMGAGLQTCAKLLGGGDFGAPVAASALMMCGGHESWHPSPDFYYKAGGGPLFDMGPYYLTALVSMLGPAKRVCGISKKSFHERIITSKPRLGEKVRVETNTHVTGAVEFEAGATATVAFSFDVAHHGHPPLEFYCENGSVAAPDPNTFGGPVRIREKTGAAWVEAGLVSGRTGDWRGIGVADMARALLSGRPHRAGAEMALHVLDIMCALEESSILGRHVCVESSFSPPELIPVNLKNQELD